MSDATNNNDTPKAVEEATSATMPKETAAEAGLTAQAAVKNEEEFKKKSKTPIIILIVVLVIAAIGVGAWAVIGQSGGFYDNAAQNGQAPYKTDEEKQAELDRVVEEGMLNISIASVIEFQNGTSEGTAYIENVPSNKYVMKVTITLDSDNQVVYESGGMKPDSHIDTIKLNTNLAAGTYPATATFTAFDPNSLDEVGQAAAKITIVVDE